MIDWQEILSRDGPAVWRTIWRVLGNSADTDEVFQETFVSALEYSKLHPVKHWRALLQRLATARAVDRLRQKIRRRGREDALPEYHLMSPELSPPELAASAELTAKLRTALAQINPGHAEVFCLFHLESWTYPEIAEHLLISNDVVGVWLHRAKGRLRELLAEMKEVPL